MRKTLYTGDYPALRSSQRRTYTRTRTHTHLFRVHSPDYSVRQVTSLRLANKGTSVNSTLRYQAPELFTRGLDAFRLAELARSKNQNDFANRNGAKWTDLLQSE